LNSGSVLRTFAVFVIVAGLACAAAPASQPTRTIPAGVSVAGIRVGNLSAEPARARIEAAFSRSVTIRYRGAATVVAPEQVGANLSVDAAVSSALAATPRSRIALPVRYSTAEGGEARRVARAPLRPPRGGRQGDRRVHSGPDVRARPPRRRRAGDDDARGDPHSSCATGPAHRSSS